MYYQFVKADLELNSPRNFSLNDISEGEFRRRCAGGSFAEKEIYRGPDDLGDDETVEVLEYFTKLKEFYIDAASKGNAVLHLIS
jgi:hypothetical protein